MLLLGRIGDGFRLIGKCTQAVNAFHPSFENDPGSTYYELPSFGLAASLSVGLMIVTGACKVKLSTVSE
ncbi:MAG: hypothetical protein WAL52_10720, partial [Candidatus Sulfotelmatobacter sp.]